MRSIFTKFILKPRLHAAKPSSSHLYGISSMRRKKVSPAKKRKASASRLATGTAYVDNENETSEGCRIVRPPRGCRCARLPLAEKLLLHFRDLASIRRAIPKE